MVMKKGNCRIWWPRQLLSCKPNHDILLFGWFFHSAYGFFDIVVATVTSNPFTSPDVQSNLKDILHSVNGNMTAYLQDHSKFSVLGHCIAKCGNERKKMTENPNNDFVSENFNESCESFEMEQDTTRYNISHCGKLFVELPFSEFRTGRSQCCCKMHKYVESFTHFSVGNFYWVQLSLEYYVDFHKEIGWIPKLQHIHWNENLFFANDIHVIIYERPSFGGHFYSLASWSSLDRMRTFRRPQWIHEVHRKHAFVDLDLVLLSINSATAAASLVENSLEPSGSYKKNKTISRLLAMLWHFVSFFLASISTFLYIILQFSHILLGFGTLSLICALLRKLFSHTWNNAHARSCELLYWPIFLKGTGSRSPSNVEYANRATLRKHSLWCRVFVDVLLGNIACLAMLSHEESIYLWILHIVRNVTNNLLRSGCVWLMGVPAGFKLNTELAELIGMISLNAVQIWSTLWFLIDSPVRYFMRGVAMSGSVFGVTITASLLIDMLKLATLHLSSLHWLISVTYSYQIQALVSLWRLFRGRKWNPLRERLDSYDYTVEQHVVSSLLFTPLLLLVPTTLVFYIFFTIIIASLNFLCLLVEVIISMLHATPFAELFFWMVRPKRFPSGVWFDVLREKCNDLPTLSKLDGQHLESDSQIRKTDTHIEELGTVISLLCSDFSVLGKIVLPHYEKVFSGFSQSSSASFAYGILSGKRIPSTVDISLPSKLPWISISFKDYWKLAFDSLLACGSNV